MIRLWPKKNHTFPIRSLYEVGLEFLDSFSISSSLLTLKFKMLTNVLIIKFNQNGMALNVCCMCNNSMLISALSSGIN